MHILSSSFVRYIQLSGTRVHYKRVILINPETYHISVVDSYAIFVFQIVDRS